MTDKLLTAAEVADMIGITKNHVYKLARTRQLSAYYPCGKPEKPGERKVVRFFRSEVYKHIRENTVKAIS